MQEYIKKILGPGRCHSSSSAPHNNTTLIISNDDMEDLIKIVKSYEGSGLLLEGVTKTVQNEIKEQQAGFLSMLFGALGARLLGNLLTGQGINKKGKRIVRAGEGVTKLKRQGKGIVRASYCHCSSKNKNNNKMDF